MTERQRLIASLADGQEDEILLARIWDRLSSGARRNIPAATCFLSEREQALAKALCRKGGLAEPAFFGGYSGAERQVAAYIPDYWTAEEFFLGEDGPVAALRVCYSEYDRLGHRDFLGSLMGQGVKREVLGDLLPGDGACDVLVLREMADYFVQTLTSVGRAKVQTAKIALSEVAAPVRAVQTIRDTVASARLDSVVASGFRLSRGKAAALIQAKKVEINHLPAEKPDAAVQEGDVISARGLGKLRVAEVGGLTKKGRISLKLEKYL